eukprot:scaffold6293_cov78-Skeletonema_dohrnii-CCMP3373.AAC.2
MIVVLVFFPLPRGSDDGNGIIGREIGLQGTGGVHDHNTRPMSTTSVASEYFRYFTGIVSISINMPYRTGVAHRSCRKYNLLGKRSGRSGTVRCSY